VSINNTKNKLSPNNINENQENSRNNVNISDLKNNEHLQKYGVENKAVEYKEALEKHKEKSNEACRVADETDRVTKREVQLLDESKEQWDRACKIREEMETEINNKSQEMAEGIIDTDFIAQHYEHADKAVDILQAISDFFF
jgi:hypothetical protein